MFVITGFVKSEDYFTAISNLLKLFLLCYNLNLKYFLRYRVGLY